MRCCVCALFVLFNLSCNLFSPRAPELPESAIAPSFAWRPPTVADIVLENLSNAFASVSPVDYARTFSPAPTTDNLMVSDFVFIPAPETAGTAGAIFQNWNIVSERRFFENFRSQLVPGSRPQFQIIVEERTLNSATDLQLSISYRLVAHYITRDIPEQTRGKSVLRLTQSSQGFWYVREWRDFRSDFDFTLSELKRRLAN
jgi:hypothetical protein